jgi:hypothetical protein
MNAKILIVAMLAAPLLGGVAEAQQVCQTLESCRSLRAQVYARVAELGGHMTASGHIFMHDASVGGPGTALRDESGVTWTDVARNDDLHHTVRRMNQYEATEYCHGIGAELPSREDFERLRSYMGASADSPVNYVPQVLPSLYHNVDGRPEGYVFWSTWVMNPDYPDRAYLFNGFYGDFRQNVRVYSYRDVAVRCVLRR